MNKLNKLGSERSTATSTPEAGGKKCKARGEAEGSQAGRQKYAIVLSDQLPRQTRGVVHRSVRLVLHEARH